MSAPLWALLVVDLTHRFYSLLTVFHSPWLIHLTIASSYRKHLDWSWKGQDLQVKLVYQSRSGPPTQPWLEPDVCDAIRDLHEQGESQVVIVPIGFISDHMEVLFDLDTEAADLCKMLGMKMVRANTAGTDPEFVEMIRELIAERAFGFSEKAAIGCMPANHDICPLDCCPAPVRPAPSRPS